MKSNHFSQTRCNSLLVKQEKREKCETCLPRQAGVNVKKYIEKLMIAERWAGRGFEGKKVKQ